MTEFVEVVYDAPPLDEMPAPDKLRPCRTAVAVRVACMLIGEQWKRDQQTTQWLARA